MWSIIPNVTSASIRGYWRIRTGITQGDTALTTELNLALALDSLGIDVDFETVWGLDTPKRSAQEARPKILSNG